MSAHPSLTALLSELVADALAQLDFGAGDPTVFPSQRPELGQFQWNGSMALAGRLRRPPIGIAKDVAAILRNSDSLARVEVAAPGFVNLTIADTAIADFLQPVVDDPRLGIPQESRSETIVLDFGGPNVAKAMHVGHLRSSILGDSLQRLLRFVGHEVISDVHLGDWGTQMGMLIIEAERQWPDLPYFDPGRIDGFPDESPVTLSDLNAMYPVVAARCKADPVEMNRARAATLDLQAGRPGYRALWQHFVDVTVKSVKEEFELLGVRFDLWLGESSVQGLVDEVLAELRAKGLTQESEGALIVPLEDRGLPPLVVQKSDGASLYSTTDLATLLYRVINLRAKRVLYVVDMRQKLHFEQVFAVANMWGIFSPGDLEHIEFGTVNGADGRPFKTRSGDVVQLRDLLDEARRLAHARIAEANLGIDLDAGERENLATMVGIGAIRFAELMHSRTANYVFDMEQFTSFDGRTGPYIQYAAVRMKSIQRKADEQGIKAGPLMPPDEAERPLYLRLGVFADAVDLSYTNRSPKVLCDYVYALSQEFNRAYPDIPVLREPDPYRQASRLALVGALYQSLVLVADILGIPIPDRM